MRGEDVVKTAQQETNESGWRSLIKSARTARIQVSSRYQYLHGVHIGEGGEGQSHGGGHGKGHSDDGHAGHAQIHAHCDVCDAGQDRHDMT